MLRNFLFVLLLVFSFFQATSQRYLQLETANDPETLKYSENDKITYKALNIPDWQSRKIEKFMVADSLVLFDNGFMRISDFDAIQTTRPVVGLASKTFMTFGVGWGFFALVDEAYNKGKQIDTKTVVIGATSFAVGYGLQKFFYKRTHKLGKRYRLRLLDLSIR